MSQQQPDFFPDFGVMPRSESLPQETTRAAFSTGQVIGQYLGTCLMSAIGIGLAILFATTLPVPGNLLASAVAFSGFGYLVFRSTRYDYAWVELKGQNLRAKHLYTRQITERSIEEIEDLLTLVFQTRSAATAISEAWLGRIRGFKIRFSNNRSPFVVCRADPAMKNAKELMEAIVYEMAQHGAIDAEIVDRDSKPLIRRIYWKAADSTSVK
ncbi:MAG: hypothetical protein NXI22_06595 [bacterium]|nr:hypothetical protein [bacterium]